MKQPLREPDVPAAIRDPDHDQVLFDWCARGSAPGASPRAELLDQTLRDGLQSPSVHNPAIEQKLDLLRCMAEVGVQVFDAGLPASSSKSLDDAVVLARAVSEERLDLEPICSARAELSDVDAVCQVADRAGRALGVYIFIGTSRIRAMAEQWSDESVLARVVSAIARARARGMPVTFVAEDASRTAPETLSSIVDVALDAGAERLCLCDTAGALNPAGARQLVKYVRDHLAARGQLEIGIDWHGHDDRAMALAVALTAWEAGADRIHATALGQGERAGNTPLEMMVVNWVLDGIVPEPRLGSLIEYATCAARVLKVPIPAKYPVVGPDAFRTATGVHASAISRAQSSGDQWLADRVYSSVPADLVGRRQEICVGFVSGRSNVRHWLRIQGLEGDPDLVEAMLTRAKQSDRVLTDEELIGWVAELRGRLRSP